MTSDGLPGRRSRKFRLILMGGLFGVILLGLGSGLGMEMQEMKIEEVVFPHEYYDASMYIGDGDDSLFVDKKPKDIPVQMGGQPGAPQEVPQLYTLTVDAATHSVLVDLTPSGLEIGADAIHGFYVIGGDIGFGTEKPKSRLHLVGSDIATGSTGDGVLRIQDARDDTMVVDGNQIETVGGALYLNHRKANDVILAAAGGKVVVGKKAAKSGLEVWGERIADQTTEAGVLRISDTLDNTMVLDGNQIETSGGALYLNHRQGGENVILVMGGGHVGIGTSNPQNELDVKGHIRAEEIIVEANWSDFVFDPDYSLMPLQDVEQYVADNGHLPGVPAGGVLEAGGVPLGESQALLMQKIEELTLYIIQQNSRIGELEERLAALES